MDGVAAPDAAPAASLPKAYVRDLAEDDKITVTLTSGEKTCNLNRPKDEPLEKALARLAKNLMAKPSKKDKRRKPPGQGAGGARAGGSGAPPDAATSADEAGPSAQLFYDLQGTRLLPLSLTNKEAWRQAKLLAVEGERFGVEYNAPAVDKVSLGKLAMVGYPLMASASLVFAEYGACRWSWAARRPGSSAWQEVGCGSARYTPTPQDEGSVLRVTCTPAAFRSRPVAGAGSAPAAGIAPQPPPAGEEAWTGEALAAETGPVQRGPEPSSWSVRCSHSPARAASPRFRVLSYNILADQYAGSDYAQNVLFNYCPKECLDPEYRRQLVLRECLGYQADVMCLQEVDEKAFSDYLLPQLGARGYGGRYTNKQGKVKEGSATFWDAARFRLLAQHDVLLRRSFAQPLPPLHAQFEPMLAASPELALALQKVTTVAQATLLAPVDPASGDGCLCVVNTHLFFHPYAPHIRTMHTAAILSEAGAFLEQCRSSPDVAQAMAAAGGGRPPALLFCGDLNSDLNDGIPGVVELLRSGRLPHDYWDWVQGAAFKWGMGEEDGEAMAQATAQLEAAKGSGGGGGAAAAVPGAGAGAPGPGAAEPAAAAAQHAASLLVPDGHAFESPADAPRHVIAVTGVDIAAPFKLRSADDLATPYTNYTSGYKALLDYVWYDEAALSSVAQLPVPSEQQLGGFIPSRAFPSDHLAVVYDLEWRAAQKEV